MPRLKHLILCFSAILLQASTPHAVGCGNEESRSCEAICSTPESTEVESLPANCTIRALVLLPDNNSYVVSMDRVLPILKVAEEHIRQTQLIPPHIAFEWIAHDDRCDVAYAVIRSMNGIGKQCAHVIFGPVCDYPLAAVTRIAKYFNSEGTPLITVGGYTYDFEKPKTTCADEFYMLVRTGLLSFETISELTIAVMKRYNWTHSIFFYERDGQQEVAGDHTCFLMMSSLGKQMRKENLTFSQYQLKPSVSNHTVEMAREIGNKHGSK